MLRTVAMGLCRVLGHEVKRFNASNGFHHECTRCGAWFPPTRLVQRGGPAGAQPRLFVEVEGPGDYRCVYEGEPDYERFRDEALAHHAAPRGV